VSAMKYCAYRLAVAIANRITKNRRFIVLFFCFAIVSRIGKTQFLIGIQITVREKVYSIVEILESILHHLHVFRMAVLMQFY